MNIYVTSETELKLLNIILNIKNFYVFDVLSFISSLHIDTSRPSNIYFINNEIINSIVSASKLKKYLGIIYINKNLTETLYHSLKKKFGDYPTIEKFVLVDNGNVAKHKELHPVFEEVLFIERFHKIKLTDGSISI